MRNLSLNGVWGLTYAEGGMLSWPEEFSRLEASPLRKLIPAAVPAPVHRVLIDAGLLDDPNYAINSLSARWVEECFWVYRRSFDAPAEAVAGVAELVFDRLEMIADVCLNGEKIGHCENALIPHRLDVTGKLRDSGNELVVVLESGVFSAADRPSKIYRGGEMSDLTKRVWLRKAQHQSGWDWHPRLQNVGILGDVRLEYDPELLVTALSVAPELSGDLAQGVVTAKVSLKSLRGGVYRLKLDVPEAGVSAEERIELPPGASECELAVRIDSPELWYPRGRGEPFRYRVELDVDGRKFSRLTGLRLIEVDQSRHPEAGRYFILKVNGRPVFCKGGNLVPADIFYSEVDAPRYRELVELACEANFNLLRIWGGGIYAAESLCDACDEAGLLIWHDFIFACAKYPGTDPAFVAEVRREAHSVTRALSHHPSMAVWCGNNELETGNVEWWKAASDLGWADHALFHHELAKIVHDNVPQCFYWPSSPMSPDFARPDDPTCGDQHPWGAALNSPGGTDFWSYRTYVDRFPNEGGMLGASSLRTLRQFLPENEQYLFSRSWDHHDNPFARRDLEWGREGHAYQTVKLWCNLDAAELSMEQYAVVSGLLQAEGLEEYIYNYRRRMFSSASAVFWMYNDSWPVSNGWTIIDYYRRRKLAFHPVRRAFAPVAVAVVEEGAAIRIYGINDSPVRWSGKLRFGIFGTMGGLPFDRTVAAELPANASTLLAEFPRALWEAEPGLNAGGAFALLTDGSGRLAAQNRLFLARFCELALDPAPEITQRELPGGKEFFCETFVWKLCLDIGGDVALPDNAFDLLPGIARFVPCERALPAAVCGNAYVRKVKGDE